MTDEEIEVACELVKAKGFRWVAGMLAVDLQPQVWDSIRIGAARVDEDGDRPGWSYDHAWYPLDTPVPDLTDPATLGCLLALARELCGNNEMVLAPANRPWPNDYGYRGPWWRFGRNSVGPFREGEGPTEGIALARAIIASRAD